MKKHVILTLEYDMGDYSDLDDEGGIPTDPKWYEETYYQSDALALDMKIISVRIEERESNDCPTAN